MKSDDVLKSHCFAFFIDGLDEFQSTVQDDHRDLVRLLCQWAARRFGNVKICVSSREYPAFMDGFSSTLRIRLHELTRGDMETYIRDKFAHASAEDSFESLVSLIMKKADGIFLWVALVVKSLREGLENGLSCFDLIQEVDILPDQLESLYRHILASLGKSARRKAYQTFAMVKELKKQNYRMSLLAYSFFDEYEAGTSFFMRDSNIFPMGSLIGDRGQERAQSTSRKLAGWCKGLVEPYKKPIWAQDIREAETEAVMKSPCIAAWKGWSMELDFAHRSVSDFLEFDDVKRDLELNLARFDPVDAVAKLIVSDILFESSTSVHNTSRSGITNCVSLRVTKHHYLGREPYPYVSRVRELLAAAKPSDSMALNTTLCMTHVSEDGMFYFNPSIAFIGESTATSEERSWYQRIRYISDPLHSFTMEGLHDYPLWLIAKNPGLYEQPSTILSLASLCLTEGSRSKDREPLVVLKALFQRGWVSPDTTSNYYLTCCDSFWSEDFGNTSDVSLWQHFLMKMLSRGYSQFTDWERNNNMLETRQWYQGRLLQLFLQFKEDTEFSFEIRVDEETPPLRRDFVLHLGKHGSVMKLRTGRYGYVEGEENFYHRPWEESETGLPLKDGVPARRHISLREFVEHSWFDNKIELLKMLDQKSEKDGHHERDNTAAALTAEKDDHTVDQTQSGYGEIQTRNANGLLKPKLINNLELHLGIISRWARISSRNEYVRYTAAALAGRPSVPCGSNTIDATRRKPHRLTRT